MRNTNEKGKMFVSYRRPVDENSLVEDYQRERRKEIEATLLRCATRYKNESPEWAAQVFADYGPAKMTVVTGKAERKCV